MYNNPQKLVAEFLGTFALILFGTGAICADQAVHGSLGLFGTAACAGLALAIMVSTLGHISGGHFNPAVTIGLWVTKRIGTIDVLLYWGAQLVGAVLAAFFLKAVIPEETWRAVALGTPSLSRDFLRLPAMVFEGLASFFLVLVVFATTVDDRGVFRAVGGFAVGLTLALGIVVTAPFTGGAVNPARAFGPALASSHWINQGVYWVGTLAGGFLAGLLYDSIYLKKP